MSNPESTPQTLTGRQSRCATTTTFSTEVFDNEVVPSSLPSISPILRVANEVEHERPRVAYICRFYALEKAQRLDPSSSGQGVRQFKTLLQRVERDNAFSLASRVKKTDAREIQAYQQYCKHHMRSFNEGELAETINVADFLEKLLHEQPTGGSCLKIVYAALFGYYATFTISCNWSDFCDNFCFGDVHNY